MKRLAFPALFTFMLLGLWIFAKSPGVATATSKSPSTKSQKSTTEDTLTEKEELFAASLSPKNQKIFTDQMDKKDRTMAMELVLESSRKGGTLTGDQAVEQIAQDFALENPNKTPDSAMPSPQVPNTQTPTEQVPMPNSGEVSKESPGTTIPQKQSSPSSSATQVPGKEQGAQGTSP